MRSTQVSIRPSWIEAKREDMRELSQAAACGPRNAAMKIVITLAAVVMLTSYQPKVSFAPVHQAQTHYIVSDEDKFLNSVMVRAYNGGDTASLKELLQYWQDAHSPAL